MSDADIVSVVTTGDPLQNPQVGDEITLGGMLFPPFLLAGGSPWGCFRGVLLKLTFTSDVEKRVTGSAVMIGLGLALAARHVLEPELEALQSGHTQAHAFAPNGDALEAWALKHVTLIGGTDFAILALGRACPLPSPPELYRAVLSNALPAVGETVMMAGFSADQLAFPISGKSGAIAGRTSISIGKVRNVFPEQRDCVMLPWPAIEIEAPAWGGMSGGPVFNEAGQLVGIVCSSVEAGDGSPGTTYASVIEAIMDEPFRAEWPPGVLRDGVTLRQSRGGLCYFADDLWC